MRTTPIASCALLALIALGAPAQAQTVLRSDDFEGPSAWQLHGLWAVDGSPSSAPGGAAYSGTHSLNFNNGRDYAGVSRGACDSSAIDVPRGSRLTVKFRCNYQTETTGTQYDQRRVVIRIDGQVVQTEQLSGNRSAPAANRCAAMGTWHLHELAVRVPPGAGRARLNVELEFNSVDAIQNDHAGWFVDDFSVVQTNVPPVRVFDTLSRNTTDFRDYSVTCSIKADRSVEVRRSQPNARFALVTGTATAAEFAALEQAIRSAALGTIPPNIPDPNTYIVRPTSFRLEVHAPISVNDNTIGGSFGIYGQWDAQLRPVMDAVDAIQDRLLQGGQPGGDDHGNDAANATPITVGDPPLSASIETAGDVDWFKVVDATPVIMIYPPPQRSYVFETTVQGNMDTVLELYAADGTTLLASNDDGGNGLASRIVHTAPMGTTLYLKVRHYAGNGTGDYTIQAGGNIVPNPGPLPPMPTPDDHANGPQGATAVQVDGSSNAGVIEVAGDEDWFQLQQYVIAIFPPPTFTYTIEAKVQGNMDTVVEVYAADGTTLLASNDDAPGLGYGSRVTWSGQAGSLVYVKVRHYSASGTGSYTLEVTATSQTP